MNWLRTTFKDWCAKEGYYLLKEDITFIERTLKQIPTHEQRPLIYEYCKIWRKAMLEEKDPSRQQARGRRAANLFLLEQKEKHERRK